MKRVLIAGKKSYIGESLKKYLGQWPDIYTVSELDTKGLKPSAALFKEFDVIFCVAGIAHVKEKVANRSLYFEVNRDLVVGIAKSAKAAGVRQFILMSSMSVYGCEVGSITKKTIPHPVTAYGESKLQADELFPLVLIEDTIYVFNIFV